jgi:hypothetical protein
MIDTEANPVGSRPALEEAMQTDSEVFVCEPWIAATTCVGSTAQSGDQRVGTRDRRDRELCGGDRAAVGGWGEVRLERTLSATCVAMSVVIGWMDGVLGSRCDANALSGSVSDFSN